MSRDKHPVTFSQVASGDNPPNMNAVDTIVALSPLGAVQASNPDSKYGMRKIDGRR